MTASLFLNDGAAAAASIGSQHYGVDPRGNAVALDQFRVPGQSMAAFASNGELNASDKRDALQQSARVMQAQAGGKIRKAYQLDMAKAMPLAAMAAGGNVEAMQALASNAAAVVREVNRRNGFMRSTLDFAPVDNGEIPAVVMPTHDVVGVVAVGPGSVQVQDVVDRRLQPIEFTIQTAVTATGLEIKRSPADLITRMYDDSIEANQTKEDRTTVAAFRKLGRLGINQDILIAGALTPRILALVCNAVQTHGLQPENLLIAANLWADIIGEPDFHAMFDPITRNELILNGRIATIFGHTIITDGFRKPNQRVLEDGEMFSLATKENVGVYTDRGGVEATAIDSRQSGGGDNRGWNTTEYLSICTPNARAVQHYQRI